MRNPKSGQKIRGETEIQCKLQHVSSACDSDSKRKRKMIRGSKDTK
jgi:hypothetical protein